LSREVEEVQEVKVEDNRQANALVKRARIFFHFLYFLYFIFLLYVTP
jgi:hypothetical protein